MLLREVGEVAALANPTDSQAVSQRAFDRARANSPIHASLSAARQIARELKLKWPEVLAVAHAPIGEQNKLLALKTRKPTPHGWLTEMRIKYVLRLVAGRLGVDTLSRIAYDAERGVLLTADARDWLHGRRLRLPSAHAIGLAAGGWDAALRIAGLKPYVPPPPTPNQVMLSRLEVMDRFYVYYKEQPSLKAFVAFARGNKLPVSRKGEVWSDTVRAWRQSRLDRRLGEPRVVVYRGRRDANGGRLKAPDYSADVGAARPGEFLFRGKWDDEDVCVAWVARYLSSLPDGTRTTARTYEAWALQTPGAPTPKAFSRHGGWSAVRRKAQERAANRP